MAGLPGAVYAAGMTALQLGWADGVRGSHPIGPVIDISGLHMGPAVSELPDGWLRFAANAPLERIRRDPLVADFPALRSLLDGIAATGIRGLATLGGNLQWASGDAGAFCAAFETRIVTSSGRRSFGPDADGLILAVEIRRAEGFVEKVGFRAAFSPARILLAGRRSANGIRLAAKVRGGPVAVAEGRLDEPLPDRLCAAAGVVSGTEEAVILRALTAGRLKEGA